MAGTLKVGGVTLATHSDATAKVSLDSGLTFPAGHIVQVQTNTDDTYLNGFTNSTWVDTPLSVSITPKFENSKIYLHHVVATLVNNTSSFGLRFRRVTPNATSFKANYTYHNQGYWIPAQSSLMTFDTPNTTSQCTYTVQVYKIQTDAYWNYNGPGSNYEAQVIAMEIAQ